MPVIAGSPASPEGCGVGRALTTGAFTLINRAFNHLSGRGPLCFPTRLSEAVLAFRSSLGMFRSLPLERERPEGGR